MLVLRSALRLSHPPCPFLPCHLIVIQRTQRLSHPCLLSLILAAFLDSLGACSNLPSCRGSRDVLGKPRRLYCHYRIPALPYQPIDSPPIYPDHLLPDLPVTHLPRVTMAFHQPTRQAMQRALRPSIDEREPAAAHPSAPNQEPPADQSQSWTLFYPVSEGPTASEFSETVPSVHTAARSRFSDIGTLNTAARSTRVVDDGASVQPSVIGHDLAEDDAELDSLDSHLPSFRSVPGLHSHRDPTEDDYHHHDAAQVLPAHDGLGSFRLDNAASGNDVQNQIYQFERFNPRRLQKRRDSIEHAQFDLEQEYPGEAEKRRRIEAWRLEHSRVLLEEVQRETRRRRRSLASLRQVQNLAVGPEAPKTADSDDMTWHDEDSTATPTPEEDVAPGSFSSTAQKFIQDFFGIDDRMLSILFGTSFMLDEEELSSTPRASQLNDGAFAAAAAENSENWRDRLMDIVSRELGLLVHQLSQHPGAFSTFSQVQQMSLPYAGLPVIPEVGTPPTARSSTGVAKSELPTTADFKPTVSAQTQPINISERRTDSSAVDDMLMEDTFTKDEWEQDLDIKLVFRYIRSRFTSRASNSPQGNANHAATSSVQDAAAKAARVRQHHPLIARARPTERRSFKATAPTSPGVALRHHSSCASQSTRRSARRSSGSSRHYWDIGGSLGTGSVIASKGPMGSWGEV